MWRDFELKEIIGDDKIIDKIELAITDQKIKEGPCKKQSFKGRKTILGKKSNNRVNF